MQAMLELLDVASRNGWIRVRFRIWRVSWKVSSATVRPTHCVCVCVVVIVHFTLADSC